MRFILWFNDSLFVGKELRKNLPSNFLTSDPSLLKYYPQLGGQYVYIR